jgi:hypothetical protein
MYEIHLIRNHRNQHIPYLQKESQHKKTAPHHIYRSKSGSTPFPFRQAPVDFLPALSYIIK